MKGVILSGGKGQRLAPITNNYAKQLVPVLGRPILFHCIDYMRRADINDICIILSPHTGKQIEESIAAAKFDARISFIYQEEPLGLAHAINCTKDFVGDSDFTVLLGDNLFDKPLVDLHETFYKNKSDSLILIKTVDRPYDFGVVQFDESGKAQRLVEKPKTFVSNYAIVGVYLFNSKIFDAISKIKPSGRGELEITDAISLQVETGLNVQTERLESYWFDSGTRIGLLDANKTMLIDSSKFDNVNSRVRNSYILGNVAVHNDTVIDDSNIMGPVFIGKNVKISNSIIGPFTTIADGCRVENSELQETVVMEDTRITNSKIYSSIIFRDLNIRHQPLIINQLYA